MEVAGDVEVIWYDSVDVLVLEDNEKVGVKVEVTYKRKMKRLSN